MSTIALTTPRFAPRIAAGTLLNAAARFWFVAAMIGQWAFFAYIAGFYGPSTLTGNFEAWAKNAMLPKGYVPGDTIGNLTFGAHALLAAVTSFGGALQLIPRLRTRFAVVHRWNGRVFFVTALLVSITGLYMVWLRGTRTGTLDSIAITINALLIIVFCIVAWRTAIGGDTATHRVWALRAYLVANGQWFMRVGMLAWVLLNHSVGNRVAMGGTFFHVWTFGCYLVPLAALELYLRAQKGQPILRVAVAGMLVVLTLLMSVGTFGLSMFLWKLMNA